MIVKYDFTKAETQEETLPLFLAELAAIRNLGTTLKEGKLGFFLRVGL